MKYRIFFRLGDNRTYREINSLKDFNESLPSALAVCLGVYDTKNNMEEIGFISLHGVNRDIIEKHKDVLIKTVETLKEKNQSVLIAKLALLKNDLEKFSNEIMGKQRILQKL